MKRICLIGNNAFGQPVFDGQRIKVRTYKETFEKEGFEVELVELDKPLKRLFKIFSNIKKAIKQCDIIVLITSDNGERILIPYINRINKKYNKRFVFSQIGTSFLYKYIKPMSEERKNKFFYEHDFSDLKPKKKLVRQLSQIDAILAETELIKETFETFFNLSNCHYLTNFRDNLILTKTNNFNSYNKLIYLSRVTSRKGIFDLMNVLSDDKFSNLSLDIYGTLSFDDNELYLFNSLLNERIKYCGEVTPDKTIATLAQYDFLCFPTKCEGEGTPGCVVESLIAGVPVLSSNFTQSKELLKDGFDSIIYGFGDLEDLEHKLSYIASGGVDVNALKANALESGKRFTYGYNREKFLFLITGKEVN